MKDNLEKHVQSSILYPYLKSAGSYLINLDPSKLGLEKTTASAVVKDVINIKEENISTKTPTSLPVKQDINISDTK